MCDASNTKEPGGCLRPGPRANGGNIRNIWKSTLGLAADLTLGGAALALQGETLKIGALLPMSGGGRRSVPLTLRECRRQSRKSIKKAGCWQCRLKRQRLEYFTPIC